jgi:hypothetical protein
MSELLKPTNMSTSKCANCGKILSCGCQKRVASNGKNCCKACLSVYELTLMVSKEKSIHQSPN